QSISLPVGPEFQANTATVDRQRLPDVALSSGGNFLVVWSEYTTGDREIRAQAFQSDGDPEGYEFQINSFTVGYQDETRAAARSPADFVVAWRSVGQDGDNGGIFAARFDSSGAALTSEFQVNTATVGSQVSPEIAVGQNDFVVVWAQSPGGEIRAQRF